MRQAATLSIGTLLGRGVAVLAMPLLTRIYSPEDFSVLASYSALLGIFAVIACFRFEVAIPLPVSDRTAFHLLVAALLAPLAIAGVIAGVIIGVGERLEQLFPRLAVPGSLWLLPPGVLLVGGYQAMQYWATRKKRFGDVARTRITQAVAGVSAMLGLGLGGAGAMGLTFGHMVMSGAGALGLAFRTLRGDLSAFRDVQPRNVLAAIQEYRRFPLWSMPEALANVAGMQIPILLIAAMADPGETGQLMLAMQVMVVPMALVGTSVGQVYLSRAPKEQRDGVLATFTLSLIKRLALVGAPPIAFLGLTAPWTFPLVFGEAWARAGVIAAMMVPWIVAQFVVVPVSMIFHVVGKTRTAMAVQVCGLILRLGGMWIAIAIGVGMTETLMVLTPLFYIFMLVAAIRVAANQYQ